MSMIQGWDVLRYFCAAGLVVCALLLVPCVKFFAKEIYSELFCDHLTGVNDPRYISPLPPPPMKEHPKQTSRKKMKLEEVLPHLRLGKRIRRASWPKGVCCYLSDGTYTRVVNIVQPDGKEEPFATNFLALIEEDWEVME